MKHLISRVVRRLRREVKCAAYRLRPEHRCHTCGYHGRLVKNKAMWPALVAEWGLTPEWEDWFDRREGWGCVRCGSSLRIGQLAHAITRTVNAAAGTDAANLRELVRDRRTHALAVAEINSAGALHYYLKQLPDLRYSEFGSTDPHVPAENLLALSYPDDAFDLVTTSDTLEHVPDVHRALAEIHRVLKPGGHHVFTTPVVWDRPTTRQRACVVDGKIRHILPPSYHGDSQCRQDDRTVFYEFGADITLFCEAAGFGVELLRDATNPALVVITARKA